MIRQKGGINRADLTKAKNQGKSPNIVKKPSDSAIAVNPMLKLGQVDYSDEKIREMLSKKSSHELELTQV